ncbi:hypothetical protein [Streptomyces sp. NPDC048581]|uniref:hypothetical protein n=1 Tax=unclassified Streptomyces TaxID=2593676 RepID=UPI003715DC35
MVKDWMPLWIAVVGLVGVVWQARRARRDARDQIKHDLELLSAIPPDLASREELRAHVDRSVRALVARSRRDCGLIISYSVIAAGIVITLLVTLWRSVSWTAGMGSLRLDGGILGHVEAALLLALLALVLWRVKWELGRGRLDGESPSRLGERPLGD